MKKRIIAALLAGMLVLQTTACGGSAQSEEPVKETQQTAGTEVSESESLEEDKTEVTALSLMKQVNTQKEQVIEDNYRTYYEVFVYSFFDSDGDGIGDLKGLTEKLDYINDGNADTDSDLGCNGIWLMPIMPSATYHKYDVIDYKAIDAEYGTMDDFKTLLNEAHKRGINVVIDFVLNHTSSQHEWFQTACEYLQNLPQGTEPDSTQCPYVDYYNFSKEKKANYYQVEGTDWYYEGQFWSEMPDLNWDNEALKSEFEQITEFWLNLGVDGFRLDAVKEFYTGADEKNIAVLTWFHDMVKSKKEDAYLVGEAWNDSSVYAAYYKSGMSFFDFAYSNSDGIIAQTVNGIKDASYYGKNLVNTQNLLAGYNENFIDAPFYTNHDIARSAGYYSGENSQAQTKIAHAMNLFMSGSAFLYYGEELGMKGSGKDENKRAPMYWSSEADAQGMCDGPKDMDTIKMKYGSLKEQEEDGNSIYHYVKQVIALRNQYPSIARGITAYDEMLSNESICVIQKTYENETVTLVFNLSEEQQSVDLNKMSFDQTTDVTGQKQIAGVLLTSAEQAVLEKEQLLMPAYSVVLLK